MTTFEITIIVLLAAVALFLLAIVIQFGVFLSRGDGTIWIGTKLSSINSKAQSLVDEVGQITARIDGFIPVFKKLLEHNESIENFWAADSSLVIRLLKEIRNCLTQDINWGELTDSQKSEILYRFTHPVVESPFKPPFIPTCETTNKED